MNQSIAPSLWLISETAARIDREIEHCKKRIQISLDSVVNEKVRIARWKSFGGSHYEWNIEESRKAIRRSQAAIYRKQAKLAALIKSGAEEINVLKAARDRNITNSEFDTNCASTGSPDPKANICASKAASDRHSSECVVKLAMDKQLGSSPSWVEINGYVNVTCCKLSD